MSLLSDVVRVLEREQVPHALIGAAALAVHGVSRSTADVDLFTVEGRALEFSVWADLKAGGADLRLLRGDSEDPLAGSVRLVRGEEIVDVVVGKFAWQRETIERAETSSIGGLSLPVARPEGLILLKLYAGGPKDAWDVQSLLEILEDRRKVEDEVERILPRLPLDAQRLWERLRSES